jgi:thiol:disulfide interchange protein
MKNLTYRFSASILLLLIVGSVFADVIKPVKWENSIKQIDSETLEIVFKAQIDKGWHLYGVNIPEGGPIATSFNFSSLSNLELLGKITSSIPPEIKYDNTFEMELELYNGSVSFTQKLKKTSANASISGYIEFMACDDSRCLPPSEIEFEFTIDKKTPVSENKIPKTENQTPVLTSKNLDVNISTIDKDIKDTSQVTVATNTTPTSNEDETNSSSEKKSLWVIFWEAVSKGLIAIFTPCVFPIIPLTVAFFMKDNTTGRRIFQALFFGLSIVAIYALVGLVAGLLQIDITELTKHWLANIIIALVLILFAASFFGMFELVLPGKFTSKLDNQVDKGGLLAPFFLALVTAVVSFSCVGPIAGVAIGAAMTGEIVAPVVAMVGFSSAFALPFVLLGMFPGLLKNMPKSGGWLNSVKVFFAFLMLVAAYIFLGNTQWAIFNRDTVLALNIITFILLGTYLIGKIKFSHDSDLPYLKFPRLMLAILSFSIAIYMVPGLFGSPLKAVAPFLPSEETSELKIGIISATKAGYNAELNQQLCDDIPKYSDKLHLPHGLYGYFDYEEGMACAREQNKPVLLDFVGHSCKNCKKMYSDVWSDPQVLELLKTEFVIIALYTDDRTTLPEDEWVTSIVDGKIKKTIGKRNVDFEITRFKSNALPLYAILGTSGQVISSSEYFTYNLDINEFIAFLKDGLKNFSLPPDHI